MTHKLLQTLVLQLRLKTFFFVGQEREYTDQHARSQWEMHTDRLWSPSPCCNSSALNLKTWTLHTHTSHQPRVSPVPSSPSLLPYSWLKWHFEFRFHCSATKVFFVTFRQIAPTAQMTAFVILEQLFSNLSGLVLSSTATPAAVVLAVLTWELTDLQNFVSLSETV